MENKEMDLTLKLGLANPTVETHVSSNTPVNTDQGSNVDGNSGENNDADEILSFRQRISGEGVVIDDNEGASNNVDVNIRVYNYIFKLFAGTGETLNFSPFPMPPSPSPAPAPTPTPTPETPVVGDYVLIDVPAGRARRNSYLAKENPWNADAIANANATVSSGSGGRTKGVRRCTNRNCNTASTPMWRRGPLGSKSLCNACGIKFRKEELKIYKRK